MSAQLQFGEMISGNPQETWTNMKMRREFKRKKGEKRGEKSRSVLQEWLCTENCLIILLIKCEPENSFPSPRAQLGWQEFKEEQLFHKGEQACPSHRQQEFENAEVTVSFAIDFWGGRILPFEKICWVKAATCTRFLFKVHSPFKSILLLSFACFYMSNSNPVPLHFFIFHMFFLLKGEIWPQKTTANWILLVFVKAQVINTGKLLYC